MQELGARTLAGGLMFGEGPRWHDGKLWLSDMHGLRVVTCDMQGTLEEIVRVPEKPSGLGWLPDGRLLLVSMDDYRLCTLSDGALQTHAELKPLCPGTPNDMVVDDAGRAYVGNFGFDIFSGTRARGTDLVLVHPDGKGEVVASDLDFPNGTVITPDGRTLIIAETFGNRLTAFTRDPATGALSGRRVFADMGERTPDGICLDAEGCVWVASFETGEYVRVRDGGEVTHRVDRGDERAVACMLGGPDGRTLFMLTADTTIERLGKGDSQARVEIAEAPAPRAGLP